MENPMATVVVVEDVSVVSCGMEIRRLIASVNGLTVHYEDTLPSKVDRAVVRMGTRLCDIFPQGWEVVEI